MVPLPPFSVDLIADLDKQFPARPPSLSDDERLVWFKAGQRDIVEFLLNRLERSQSITHLKGVST